jgi:hypothetical protein
MAGEVNPAQMGGMCRFYEREYPELEETVMVNVKRIAEMGAYVQVSFFIGAALHSVPAIAAAISLQPLIPHDLAPAPSLPHSCSSSTTSRE